MRIESELVHIDSTRVVVKVTLWSNEGSLGSSLGEAKTIDLAETTAINKVLARISNKEEVPKEDPLRSEERQENLSDKIDGIEEHQVKQLDEENKSGNISNKINLPIMPDDWSTELSNLDVELKRISWTKQDENFLLQKIFNYNNRSRITKYIDLKVLLFILRSQSKGQKPQDINLEKQHLINKTTELLKTLNWDSKKGRDFIENHFNVNTRQNLNRIQLLEFIMILDNNLLTNSNYKDVNSIT